MKKNMKHRVLAVSSAVLCVIAMTLSVTVLPGLAYANIAKNPLFAAVLAAAAENNMGQSKSGEGGGGKKKADGEAGKEVKGDKAKEVDKKEGNRAAKGEAGNDSERVDNKGSKGNSENPNVVGSVSNGNGNGNGTGDAAGNGAKSGKDANGENKKPNVPANAPKNKSKEKDKQADKNKGKNKNVKDKAKEKAKSQDRSAGGMEKLNLEQVKALPACVTVVNMTNSDGTIDTLSIEPPSGESKCAVSADAPTSNFDSIRDAMSNLGPNATVGVYNGDVYAYGHLSKNRVGLFSGEKIRYSYNIDKFDVSNVTDMSYLFKNSSLTDFSFLSNWDVSNVTNMESMFSGCAKRNYDDEGNLTGVTGLTDISPLSKWNVSNVRNMNKMFSAVITCSEKDYNAFKDTYASQMLISSLKPLENWNVSNVTSMIGMFEGCTEIKDFTGLEKWNTKNVISMNSMFRNCIHSVNSDVEGDTEQVVPITFKPLKNWNVSNVTDMRDMFALCDNIGSTEDLGNWNVSKVEHMDDMFAMCTGLNNINELANWNTKGKSSTRKLTSTFRMFYECNSIKSIEPLKDWNVGNVKNMHDMFNGCSKITSLQPLSGWSVGSVENMSGMFYGCSDLKSLSDLEKWNVGSVENMSDMFNGCSGLKNLSGLENWNVNNVKDMNDMFFACTTDDEPKTGLNDISALSSWANKVGKVTDMHGMFGGCAFLTNIKCLKDWKVDNVEDMHNMFNGCSGLSSLSDLAKWNVGKVTNMSGMFSDCGLLSSLTGLENWDVSKVTDMHEMFSHSNVADTDKLTDISALSCWNVGNVTDMHNMFSDCQSLTGDADLSKWDIKKVTNLSLMFSNAGADSGDKLVLDFSNKTFTKPSDSKSHFSVDSMFSGFKGTLIANGWSSSGFGKDDGDDPVAKHFAKGDIFSLDENDRSDNIVITNNGVILTAISEDETPLKKIAYYIPVKAKLMEPGDMPSCKCDDSSVPGGTTGGTTGGTAGDTTYTYYVPALYDSSTLERQQNEKSQYYAYRVVKNSFASKFRSAIDSQSGKEPSTEEPGGEEQPGGEEPDSGSRSAKLKSRVKELRSIKKSRSVRDVDDEDENPDEDPEPEPDEKQGNTYKIMFKKSSGDTCTWTELGEGENGAVPVGEPKSPLIFFTTMYYLETFVQPVPLPHTGGQSAVMFTFLSIGLFSMFAVAGAFGRHGWVASVLTNTALAGFAKIFGGGALDIASGAKHCFAHYVAHSVVSGFMLKTAVSAATGFFARFRGGGSTFCKHAKQL